MRPAATSCPSWKQLSPSQPPGSCSRAADNTAATQRNVCVCVCVCVCCSPILFLSFSSSPSVNTNVCGEKNNNKETQFVLFQLAFSDRRGNKNTFTAPLWTTAYDLRWASTCFLGHTHTHTHTHSSRQC